MKKLFGVCKNCSAVILIAGGGCVMFKLTGCAQKSADRKNDQEERTWKKDW